MKKIKGQDVLLLVMAVLLFVATWLMPVPKHVAYAQTSFSTCESSRSTATFTGATSGTAATQIVGLVAGEPIYVCALTVVGASGTAPTFSLVYGTGANCATGQTVFFPATATVANAPVIHPGPFVGTVPAGKALCYLDGGTTPVQNYILVVAQG